MTITRRWQAGFESNGNSGQTEFSALSGTVTASNTYAKTGTYSVRAGNSANRYGIVTLPATRQIGIGCHLRLDGTPTAGNNVSLISWVNGSTVLGRLYVNDANGLVLEIAGSAQDTEAGASPILDWAHIGIDIKVDVSAGWVKIYKDGTEILSFAGNTGNADIDSARFGSGAQALPAANYMYFDDVLIDDTTGEGAAAVVPDRRFEAITPTANGTYSQCTGSDGNTTNNYLLVDDRPHNSDTDYSAALAADERDTYGMSDITLGAGFAVAAVIPFVYAKKTDAAVATQMALALRKDGTDWTGATKDLPTSYGFIWERRTTQPGGGNWDQASVNGLESGFVGKGTF